MAGELQSLREDLVRRGYKVEEDNGRLVASRSWFRLRWMATKLTVFIVVREARVVDSDAVYAHLAWSEQAAASRWNGLRGMQQGYAIIPLLVGTKADAGAEAALGKTWRFEFARFTIPAVFAAGRMAAPSPPRLLGVVYHGHLRRELAACAEALRAAPKVPVLAP